MKNKVIIVLCVVLLIMCCVPAAAIDHPISDDEGSSSDRYADALGWDLGLLRSLMWTASDGKFYKRSNTHELEFYEDQIVSSFNIAMNTLGITDLTMPALGTGNGRNIVEVALNEIGSPDSSTYHNKYNFWFYGGSPDFDAPDKHWCCAFIAWCADQCGLIEDGTYKKTAGCRDMRNYLVNVKQFQEFRLSECVEFGGSQHQCQPGDIIVFHATPETWNHIVLVSESKGPNKGVETVNGNWGNRVCKLNIPANPGRLRSQLGDARVIAVEYPESDTSIFGYLKSIVGLNTAAACGVMANIEQESAFNPKAVGDGGNAYGLCQWNGERMRRLISWCRSKGYDYTTIEGQMMYLRYEVTQTNEKKVMRYMNVGDTVGGAYTAGYNWCIYFERPANAGVKAVTRGNKAKQYWGVYGR